MSITLRKMKENVFDEYLVKSIPAYALENIESGRWIEEGAIERSRADHESLLPDGIHTKNNYLFEVITGKESNVVGVLWVNVDDTVSTKSAFIYDIEIYEDHRRQGYAKQTLNALECFVKDLGINKIGLHVFRQNAAAQSLYEAMGYRVVSSNMSKSID